MRNIGCEQGLKSPAVVGDTLSPNSQGPTGAWAMLTSLVRRPGAQDDAAAHAANRVDANGPYRLASAMVEQIG